MDIADAIEHARENSQAVLATVKRDGTPQMSPVTIAVVDESIMMSTRETAFKVKNLRRDPRAWLCVVSDKWFGLWVQIDCTAEIVSQPEAMDLLVEYYRTLRGEHPDWGEYRQAMADDERCIVRFHAVSAGPDASG